MTDATAGLIQLVANATWGFRPTVPHAPRISRDCLRSLFSAKSSPSHPRERCPPVAARHADPSPQRERDFSLR